MAGIIIENPLFNEKPSASVSTKEYSLLGDDQHRGLIEEPRQHFHKLLAKPWQFRFLKGLHWLLLLLITILCLVGSFDSKFALEWSSCWNFLRSFVPWYILYERNTAVYLVVFALLMATGSLVAQRWKGKTQLPSIALADICLGWAFIFVQFLIAFFYGLRSYTEYSWFYPKLRDPSTSLAELTEFNDDHYRREWYRWRISTEPPAKTISPAGDLKQMEERKLFIMARLVLDPTIMVVALVAVLLQAGLLLFISRAIKRSRVWASNYRLEHPNCTEQEAKYAKFWPLGLIKLALVFITLTFLFTLPITDRLLPSNFVIYASLALACLVNRICYLRKVRFRHADEYGGLLDNFHRNDCTFYFFGFLVVSFLRLFITNYFYNEIYKYADCTILCLFLIAFVYTFWLQSGGGGKMGRSIGTAAWIPRISINVEFNAKKSDEDEQKLKKDVEEVAAGQMEKAEEAKEQIQSGPPPTNV